MRYAPFQLMFTLFLAANSTRADAPAELPWEHVDDEDGIRVFKRDVPGSDLPAFRGETTMAVDPEAIIGVLLDWRHHTEWIHRCTESTQLAQLGDQYELLMYYRIGLPWPVWDRDAIYVSHVERSADGKTTVVTLRQVQSDRRPVPPKVIRMPRFYASYELVRMSEAETRVTYEAEADPGGGLPRWIVARIVRDIPHETLARLRARVQS